MKIDCDNLIRALKTLAMSEGLSQKELGASLGFSLNRTKNLFSGRSKLSGEEVLRILTSREHPLPKLKRYLPLCQLQQDLWAIESENRGASEESELAVADAQAIQGSLMTVNVNKPLAEMARDVMHDKKWRVLPTGWICSVTIVGDQCTYDPIAPDFVTAVSAMKKMGWIWKRGSGVFANWNKINGGMSGEETAGYCENALRSFILDPENDVSMSDSFRRAVQKYWVGASDTEEIDMLRNVVENVRRMAEHWVDWELSDEPNEYGVSPKQIYANKFDYFEQEVLGMRQLHFDLLNDGTEIPSDLETRYRETFSEDGKPYKYSYRIDPILKVNDGPGPLVDASPEDWKRYHAIRDGS